MKQNTHSVKLQHTSPPLRLLARESASFAYMRLTAAFGAAVPVNAKGTGQKVVVIPGFMASDMTTARLRRSLGQAGFECHGWGLGRNNGVQPETFNRLAEQLEQTALNDTVTLVGWSLGGVVAREFAKQYPHKVDKVITLGSPFSGNPRANNAWRLYEAMAGYKVDELPMPLVLHEKPPVHTIAFWSANDGVVSSGSACGQAGESDQQIELDCRHMAFVARPDAINAIAAAVAGEAR
jgi:hypothetical protein